MIARGVRRVEKRQWNPKNHREVSTVERQAARESKPSGARTESIWSDVIVAFVARKKESKVRESLITRLTLLTPMVEISAIESPRVGKRFGTLGARGGHSSLEATSSPGAAARARRASAPACRPTARAMIRAFFMTHISGSPSGHRHTERIAPRWCWLAPHTRASACTRACTLYGCAARAPHGNDESSTLEHLASGPRFRSLRPTRGFLSLAH